MWAGSHDPPKPVLIELSTSFSQIPVQMNQQTHCLRNEKPIAIQNIGRGFSLE